MAITRKNIKVSQIISAATEEFLEKGLDASSMQNIAEQAAVSKRTLYKYYPTKEALYEALIEEILECMQGNKVLTYSPNSTIHDQIEQVVTAKIELLLSDSFINISKIVLGGLLKGRTPSPEQMQRLNESESQFLRWIKLAQKDRKIKTNIPPKDIASQFHSILKGEIYWPVLLNLKNKEDLDLKKIKSTTINFFINSFCM